MTDSEYDYIVVGAGSAGCAVAERLSADPTESVLLIEAGRGDRHLSVRAPLGYSGQFGKATDWAFETEPEPHCAQRRIPQPRGKVLGGTSAMNAMVWVRGSSHDYDSWNVPGWSWADVEPVFRRIENDGHSGTGPMYVTRVAQPTDEATRFVAAARNAGEAANDDISGPQLDGAALSPVTIWRGQRWSTARAYLDSASRRRNLTVATGSTVHQVVIERGNAVGVRFGHRRQLRQVRARREIILCAGAFGTPQLLQLSGIGPADHLRRVGILPIVDSPNVGANLTDHPATYMNWELMPGRVGLSDAGHPRWALRWLLRRNGKLASNFMEALAHIRTTDTLTAPDFQLICGPAYIWDFARAAYPRPAMAVIQSYWTPQSTGSVQIRSADPTEAPRIRLNQMQAGSDVKAFIRAIRRTREIVAAEPLASILGKEIHPGPAVRSDADLERWIRETSGTTGHPACSARMGTDPDSVLDERLRVRGVQHLRVADASAFPAIPRANTNAPAILFGERCAQFVREDANVTP
ncbi:GMC family oxidoreductase N-terminal domain-containing protein [Mycolicibacterium sp. lyk4-40-TYG-92]|uniref:GMC family oxidoreductase n=1 Tax=Mycolicibacterium sp. lyk4-40-TYG-92 TaxID=3040295 RepID=UPI00254DB8AF|nr:GMC family oxidoreductase N-terminal domain-containing protein [Mycolicibacterium sp. lyk4-40-TYG-92]